MWHYIKTTSNPDNLDDKTHTKQHVSYEENIEHYMDENEENIEIQSSRNFTVMIVAIVMLACTIIAVVGINATVEIMDRKVEIQRLQTLEACYNSAQLNCGDKR